MFQLPTLKDLAERARQSFRANLKGSDAWVWPNNVYASAKVMAGGLFELFGFAAYIEKEIFAHRAPDIESLTRHGVEFGIAQKPAAPAQGNAVFTFVDDGEVTTGAVLRRSDGVEFIVTAGGTRNTTGTITVPIVAALDGLNSNTEANAPLEIISGVSTTSTTEPLCAVDANGLALGADIEDIESFRARILFRKRNPPHGGSAADYVMWVGEVSGVSFFNDRPTVFVERQWQGAGTVRVFPLMYDLYADGIPTTADVLRVFEHVEALRPAGAMVTIAKPDPVVVNVIISGMVPNTTEVQEAVREELADAFFRLSRPAGTDNLFGSMPYLASPFSFSRSWIWQAVANATGEERHAISAPAADIELQPGQMAVLGTIDFVG